MRLLVILSFLLHGCGDKVQKLSNDLYEIKSAESILACHEIKFPQRIEFNGTFIYSLPQCASNKTITGSESLPASIALVKTVGIAGLDTITDFLKSNPGRGQINTQGEGENKAKIEYPLIRAAMAFLTRGVFKQGQEDTVLLDRRFGELQQFLLQTNPAYLIELLLQFNEKQKIPELLATV